MDLQSVCIPLASSQCLGLCVFLDSHSPPHPTCTPLPSAATQHAYPPAHLCLPSGAHHSTPTHPPTSACMQARTTYESLRKSRLDEFMSAFNIISLKLKEMYQMITLGGDAELELVDSLDPFSEVRGICA